MRVVADDAIPWLREALAPRAGLEVVCLPSSEVPRAMHSADAAIVRTVTRVDAALLADCPRLRFLGTASAGFDHLDVTALEGRGVVWSHAPGCNADAVADWVVAAWHELERADESSSPVRKRVAVIGLGQTGARVAARLAALGHELLAIDPIVLATPPSQWAALPEDAAAIRETLARDGRLLSAIDAAKHGPVDAVTLHVPLTVNGPHATRAMLDLRRWHALGSPPWCLNASRGEVFDVAALVDHAWHAPNEADLRLALDVWPEEPALPVDWLGDARLVLATPHVAGYGRRAKWRATRSVCDALTKYLGLPPSDFTPAFSTVVVDVRVQDDAVLVRSTVDGGGGRQETKLPHDADTATITRGVLRVTLGLHGLDEALRSVPRESGDGAAHFLALRRRAPHRVELAEVVVQLADETPHTHTDPRMAELSAQLSACGAIVKPPASALSHP